jgi:hypothetical protein
MYYLETPAEPGQVGQLERAVADSEDILDDLYTWSSTTSGIHRIDPSQAQAADNNDGSIVIVRQFSIEFER